MGGLSVTERPSFDVARLLWPAVALIAVGSFAGLLVLFTKKYGTLGEAINAIGTKKDKKAYEEWKKKDEDLKEREDRERGRKSEQQQESNDETSRPDPDDHALD